ncbi:hypothetical protein GCM10020219_068710 [Nonomuraea dietziae]
MDAVALTDVGEDDLTAAHAALTAVNERLRSVLRQTPSRSRSLLTARSGTSATPSPAAPTAHALPLLIEVRDGGVRAEVVFRPLHEGPPGAVHGGISAMILDHLLGQAVAAAGSAGMTGTLTVRYRRPVPYGTPLVATAEYTRTEGRKTWAEGRISLPDGESLVEATGLFITPSAWISA